MLKKEEKNYSRHEDDVNAKITEALLTSRRSSINRYKAI